LYVYLNIFVLPRDTIVVSCRQTWTSQTQWILLTKISWL